MKSNRWAVASSLCLLGLALCAGVPAAAQSFRVEKVAEPAPQELSAAVRATLSDQVLRVTGSEGPLCEIWLRKELPVAETPQQGLGITFGQIAEGELVGAVRFPAEVIDYRSQHIKPGVYTLRYELLPVDGNHMGVAPQRDFLLASPAAVDTDPATVTHDQTVDLSRKTTGTKHPSVWSLGPSDQVISSLPLVTHDADNDLWLLHFQVSTQAGSSPLAQVVMALVVKGHSPET